MASLNHRGRDPLLDSKTQAFIERRSRELLGLILIGAGVAVALMLGSYSPSDPNWLVSSDAPLQNLLGRPGAWVAAFAIMILGVGSWALVPLLSVWGVRLLLHWGGDRLIGRLILAPIFIALCAILAATLRPGGGWSGLHSFGLGGLFGDTVLGAVLTAVPMGAAMAGTLLPVVLMLTTLALGLFTLGFTRRELARGARLTLYGLLLAYAGAVRLLDRTLRGAAHSAHKVHEQRNRRNTGPGAAVGHRPAGFEPPVTRPAGSTVARPPARDAGGEPPRPGFLAALIRRPALPDPELVEPDAIGAVPAPGDERIRTRIAQAIAARAQPAAARLPVEPPLGSPKRIDLADGDGPGAGARREPPLTALPLGAPAVPPPALPSAAPRTVIEKPARTAPPPSRRARAEAQPALAFDTPDADFELPPLALLEDPGQIRRQRPSDEALEQNARMLESVLDDYGVKGEIVSVRPGPVVTMYELEPAPGLKASRVIGLADDIARSMAALSARVSTVPGRSVIGIELPNDHREKVVLREILASRDFGDSTMRLPLALGKNIGGEPVVANLAKMPHLLIAGTTGSGKSVAINTMILSLLYRLTPEDCRLIMIDPKMLELSVYDGIPHLLSPVVTDPKKAVVALKWVVAEMEDRYRKMSKMGVRNIEGYNGRVREALARGEMFTRTVQTGFDDETGDPVFETEALQPEALPYIVVIVDEMADLMMVAGKEIEACIQRLAQMARASGIHLIMATQRPSVDVITGTIKANFPTRVSFQVTSKIDSRTILGEMGAEQLLGMGDMLYMAGGAKITRCHAPFVSDEEVEEIVNHLKGFGPPDYVGGVIEGPDEETGSDIDLVLGLGGNTDGDDALYDQAVAVVIKDRKCSTSYIQRKLAIGYNKAARLVEQMEDQGLVSPANHVGKREILVPEPQ